MRQSPFDIRIDPFANGPRVMFRPSRANQSTRTEAHPIRTALRERRRWNIGRKFATGHWRHRVIDAVPA